MMVDGDNKCATEELSQCLESQGNARGIGIGGNILDVGATKEFDIDTPETKVLVFGFGDRHGEVFKVGKWCGVETKH